MCFTTKISATTRRWLVLFVWTMTILHLMFGVVLVVGGLWVPSHFNVRLLPAETLLIQQVVGSVAALGAAAAAAQLLGAAALRVSAAPHRHARGGVVLGWWAAGAAALAVAEATGAALLPLYAVALAHQLRRTLHRGMSAYLADARWKVEMDNLQQRHACCGVERPSDWQHAVWLQQRHLRGDKRSVLLYTEADGRVLPPALPFSCCAPGARPPCLHDPLQQASARGAWEERPEEARASVRAEGCVAVLLVPLYAALYAAAALLAAAAFAQVAALVATRLLYTAARNAALRGLPRAGGWSWLGGRGDLHWRCGRSLQQLEERRAQRRRNRVAAGAGAARRAAQEGEQVSLVHSKSYTLVD